MDKMQLTMAEQNKLLPIVEAEARKVLVFDTLSYIETKTFSRDGSVYHIFGASNKALGCLQSVTFSPTDNCVSYSCHTNYLKL